MSSAEQQESIEKLISLAERALMHSKSEGPEAFLDDVSLYLSSFESWQAELKGENPLQGADLGDSEKQMLKAALERLSSLHERLLQKAGGEKDEVGHKMGEMHRRASGLKKYVDTLPSRISIAGKRKG